MMHRRSARSFLTSKALLAVVCAAIIMTVGAMIREGQRRNMVAKEIRAMQDEVTRLEQQRNRLSDLIRAAESPEFLEREARLRLGLQKPGESVLIVPEAAGGANESGASTSQEPPSNPRRWWRHIFK
ncbi:septum formation initiator family protein [Candidatus Uhrbacteria bacterium]|nr:septum formation initiator family protein [Candidatus Uhrbacteria bacterium]